MPLNDPDDPFDSLVYLSPDGKIERPAQPTDQRRPPESWTQPSPPAPLELNHVGYQAPAQPAEPDDEALAHAARVRQQQQLAIGAAAIVLLFAAAAFFLLRSASPGPAEASTNTPAAAPDAPAMSSGNATAPSAPIAPEGVAAFTVDSDPPGASVFVGDEELGTTPLLGTNDFARDQTVKLRLELRGYQPWTGTFTGGKNTKVVAHLKHK